MAAMTNGNAKVRHYLAALGTVLALGASSTVGAQVLNPPIEGTVALDQTVQQEYTGVHFVLVKTMAGFGHVGRFTKGLFIHRATATGSDGSGSAQKRQAVSVQGQR
jgi:hypothetical protein